MHRTAEVAEGDSPQLLRLDRDARVFLGLLERRTPGADGSAALPDDFDGIVAGAPAADFTGIGAQFIKDVRAQFPDPKNLTPLLPAETLQSVAAQILDKCDALDGVKDGVMEDPRQCKVDVSTLTGLSAAQQAALKTIYAPTRAGSETVFPGSRSAAKGAGRLAGVDLRRAAAARSAAGAEPALRIRDAAVQVPRVQRSRMGLPDVRPVDLEGGHGADRVVPERDESGSRRVQGEGAQAAALARLVGCRAVAARHDQVLREVKARDPKMDEYVRMFMMPGVLHCGGGAGPDNVDWAAAIDGWVEKAARRRSG